MKAGFRKGWGVFSEENVVTSVPTVSQKIPREDERDGCVVVTFGTLGTRVVLDEKVPRSVRWLCVRGLCC